MSSFTKSLLIENIDGKNKRIKKSFRFFIGDKKSLFYIQIPKNFISDGASIPKFLWSIVGSPWTGNYPQIAVVHDWLYRNYGVIRIPINNYYVQNACKYIEKNFCNPSKIFSEYNIKKYIKYFLLYDYFDNRCYNENSIINQIINNTEIICNSDNYLLYNVPFITFKFNRKASDLILLHGMEILNVPEWKRKLIYLGVRIGGKSSFRHELKNNLF